MRHGDVRPTLAPTNVVSVDRSRWVGRANPNRVPLEIGTEPTSTR